MIFIVRHGRTASNENKIISSRNNEELSERGQIEAANLSKTTKNLDIRKILSSSSIRAMQTAEIITDNHLNVSSFSTHDELQERVLGPYEGLGYDELAKKRGERGDSF